MIKPFLSLIWNGSPYEALDRYVTSELKKRNFNIRQVWQGYGNYLSIVLDLQRILEKNCWGFPPVFTPDDDYAAIGQILTGDLCEVETLIEIEEKYGVKLIENRKFNPVVEGDMLQIVRFLHEKKYSQSSCSKD